MGARSGGGASAGMGSKSRSGGAGWNEGGRSLLINGVEQETEKAIKANIGVSWNDNSPKNISLWIPKSAIAGKGTMTSANGKGEKSTKEYVNIKDWFQTSLKMKVNSHGWQGVFNHDIIGERW